jgi:hypothetical protein
LRFLTAVAGLETLDSGRVMLDGQLEKNRAFQDTAILLG